MAPAQEIARPPRFEVASIRPVEANISRMVNLMPLMGLGQPPGTIPMPDPGRVLIRKSNLVSLVSMAYRIPLAQIAGAAWMQTERFDVEATVPDNIAKEQINEMLRMLLVERFGLAVHRESSQVSGYMLLPGKSGLRLNAEEPLEQPPEGQTESEKMAQLKRKAQKALQSVRQDGGSSSGATVHFPRIALPQLASVLSQLLHTPVVDGTSLRGRYAVTLVYSTEPAQSEASIFEAVEKLGFRLERRRVNWNTLTIDQARRAPTPN